MRSLTVVVLLAGCAGSAAPAPAGGVDGLIDAAATEAGVPADLVRAIAIEEGGIRLPAVRLVDPEDHVPMAGLLELRHGRLDTLALGARLLGTSEDALRADTDLATRAGARVLAMLGEASGVTGELASWRAAVEELSGLDDAGARAYAERVFALLRQGGEFAARDGQVVRLGAHGELAAEIALPIAPLVPATPDYPDAMWFTTSCTNKCTVGRPLGNAAVDKIVIHDTEGGWNASVATLQFDSGKSVHYLIDADGVRVGQFRPETDTTYHAGNFFYNETSIGIEHVGVASDPAGYSAGLYARSRDLVMNIRTRWTVPVDRTHIIGHYQIPDGTVIAESSPPCTDTLDACETSARYGGAANHRDPGYHWQWCQYMEALGGSCTCNDAYPLWNCTTDHAEAVRCVDGNVEIAVCVDGCDVMPIGVEDVCHTGSGSAVDPGTPSDAGCGCGADRGQGASVLAAGVVVLVSRRRRRVRA